jgi:hypothetical protein
MLVFLDVKSGINQLTKETRMRIIRKSIFGYGNSNSGFGTKTDTFVTLGLLYKYYPVSLISEPV